MQRSASQLSPPDAVREWWWIFDPRQSLRARAALSVGFGALAFTALLTWLTGLTYQRALETQLRTSFETLAFQLSDKLDRTVYERYRNLLLAANLASLRDPTAPLPDRRRTLQALQEAHPDLAWLAVTDAAGRILVSTHAAHEGSAAGMHPWFRGARESAHAGPLREISDLARSDPHAPDRDPETSSRFFDLAVPVSDLHGQFAGVLAAHVRWSWAREVQLSVIPETLVRQQIGATVYFNNDVLLDSGASGWTHPPDAPAVPDNRHGRGALLENTSLGTTYLTGFARSRGVREYRGLGWLTVIRQPAARAFAPVTTLRRTIAAWGGALSLAAMALAWNLAGRHARRLRSVRAAAERIHEGDILTVLPRPPGNSELSRMCASLDTLVEDLRARQSAPEENKQP